MFHNVAVRVKHAQENEFLFPGILLYKNTKKTKTNSIYHVTNGKLGLTASGR